jgi:hypothetical protein
MGNVLLFTFAPGGLGVDFGVGASLNDVSHSVPEAAADVFDPASAPGVFTGVMQERANGLILVTTMLQCDTGDAQQVSNVGNGGALALLAGVDQHRVLESMVELS